MDGFTLHPGTMLPEKLIEDYDSFIWTERFSDYGEFEIKSTSIQKCLEMFYEDTLISHKDTRQVGIVEDYLIEWDESLDSEAITVTGRTFESIIDRRAAIKDGGNNRDRIWITTPERALEDLPRHMIAYHIINGTVSVNDVMNNVVVTSSVPNTSTPSQYVIPYGDLAEEVMEVANGSRLGIRSIRPLTISGPEGDITIDVYKGADRSVGNTESNEPLVFSRDSGDLEAGSYFYSTREFKNVAYVIHGGTNGVGAFTEVYAPGWSEFNAAGKYRRVLYVDASDMSIPLDGGAWIGMDFPAKLAHYLASVMQRGQRALKEFNRQKIVEATVSSNSSKKYGVDYGLGDIVNVDLGFGIQGKFQISEHIRVDDSQGDIQYPTLVEPGATWRPKRRKKKIKGFGGSNFNG